jgi:hypothetical protein
MNSNSSLRIEKQGIRDCNLLRSLFVAVALIPLLTSPAAAQDTNCPGDEEAEFIMMINDIRADSSLNVLATDARMMVAARRHATDMATNDFLSHIGSDGSTFYERLADAGYDWPLGEVIVVGTGASTVASMFQMWVDDDPHRAVILHPDCTHVGAGWATRPSGTWVKTCTVVFGRGSGAAEAPDCPCCAGRVGDANLSGEAEPDEVTLGDIMLMVDVKFISGDCGLLQCIPEADVNQDGGTAPTCDDHVTLGDIMTLVDFLFITGPENATLPDCL